MDFQNKRELPHGFHYEMALKATPRHQGVLSLAAGDVSASVLVPKPGMGMTLHHPLLGLLLSVGECITGDYFCREDGVALLFGFCSWIMVATISH